MNTLKTLCLAATAATTLAAAQAHAAAPADSPLPQRVLLTLNGDPARQMAVSWRTDVNTTGVAQYMEAPHGPRFQNAIRLTDVTSAEAVETTGGVMAYYKSVTLSDLKPSTRYAYRVGDGTAWSEWNHFETASDKPESFRFIYMGDPQNDILEHWSRVVRDAFRRAPDARFMLYTGDIINNANFDWQWAEWFEAGGWINRTIPTIATPGNHEYILPKGEERRQLSRFWEPQFEFPANGLPQFKDSNYYLDYQGVRFVSLNSNLDHEEQGAWLDKVLGESPGRWTIVMFHHPVYSAAIKRDNAELREVWQPIIEKHNVDLVLQGHDHTYARSRQIVDGKPVDESSDALGPVYTVSVSGPKMYDLTQTFDELMIRMAEDTQLYQVISVDGDTLSYESYTANGQLYDAFDLHKQPGGKSKLENKIPATPEYRRK